MTQSGTWGPRSLTIGHYAGFLEGGIYYTMGQVTGQALETDGDVALELVFHVNAHPLLHIAREGWESTASWYLCQYVLLEASFRLLSVYPMFSPLRAELCEAGSRQQTKFLLVFSNLHPNLVALGQRWNCPRDMPPRQ